MFLFKKQFAIFVLIFIGFLTLSGYFINNDLYEYKLNYNEAQKIKVSKLKENNNAYR